MAGVAVMKGSERKLVDVHEDDMTEDQLKAEQELVARAQAHHDAHVDHPLDEHGNPVVEHLYWTFAVILEPRSLPEMQEWLRAGLSRADTVGDLPKQTWKNLAAQGGHTVGHKLTTDEVEALVQLATDEFAAPFEDFVIQVAEKIDKIGLRMQVVQRTDTSQHNVVLLLRCPEDLFLQEHKNHALRRWKATGEGLEFYNDEQEGLGVHLDPSEADRIQLISLLLTKDDTRGGCGFGNLEHLDEDEDHDPRIVAIFPLHNPEYVETITQEWKQNASFCRRLLKLAKAPFRCRGTDEQSLAEAEAAERAEKLSARLAGHKEAPSAPALHESSASAAAAKAKRAKVEARNNEAQTLGASVDDAEDIVPSAKEKWSSSKSLGQSVNNILPQAKRMQELLENDLAPDVLKSEKKFLKQIQSQYGDRFAFLFAFMQAFTQALIWLNLIKWVIKPVFWLVDALVPDNVDLTRLYDGLYGLLVPCIWCPIFLGLWDRHSQQLRREWGVVGVTELPILSPFYRKSNEARSLWARLAKKVGVGICGFAGVVAVFWLTFVQLELEVLTQIIPVCDSFFWKKVWAPHVSYDTEEGYWLAWPSCFAGSATGLTDVWRGVWFTIQGIATGLIIDQIVTVFSLIGELLAKHANERTWQEYELKLVNLSYPLELGVFNFYYWFLAFVFIPFGEEIQMYLLADGKDVMIDIYDNHNQHFISPCYFSDDAARLKHQGLPLDRIASSCDEWRGTCPNNTDIDCRHVGCTDPTALNFDPTADPTKSIDNLRFPPWSLDGIAVPEGVLCQYNTTIDQIDSITTCPTSNNGQCDEPLHCLMAASLQHPWIASSSYHDCEESIVKDACPVGSDTLDCRDLAAEILRVCLSLLDGTSEIELTGCMKVLQHRFSRGDSPQEACKRIKPSDPTGALCAAFGETWPSESSGWAAEMDSVVIFREKSIRCSTPSAHQCLVECDPCVGCFDGVVDRATDGGNMTFCEEYQLCSSCIEACNHFGDCFPATSRERAAVGNSCERIGWVNNGYCNAQHEAAELDCLDDHAADSSWVCDDADDVNDCSKQCNFGCTKEDDINYRDSVYHYEDSCTGKTKHSVRHMLEIWLYDKRFLNQIDAAMATPIITGLIVPFCIEFLLSYLCGTWRKSTRRRAGYKGKSFRLGRCLCCACHKCKCCISMMNCFMCDSTAQSDVAGTPATTIDDEELATKITAKVSHPVRVRTKEWNSKHRGQYEGADEIILESMLEPINLADEFKKQSFMVMLVSMYSIVMPAVSLVGMIVVELRMKTDFYRLTKFARRPIPVKPQDDDATGGYRPWLQTQMFLACIVSSLLFCITTGQLEAFAALSDADACSPPTYNRTQFKFPGCMDELSIATIIAETEFDETSTTDMYEPADAIDEDYRLVAMNRSCWESVPTLDASCPFEVADADFDGTTLISTRQILIRFVCFILIEHVQFGIIYVMAMVNRGKKNSSKKSWHMHRLTQHHLVAEHLFPSKVEDKVHYQMATKNIAKRLRKRLQANMAAKVTATSTTTQP